MRAAGIGLTFTMALLAVAASARGQFGGPMPVYLEPAETRAVRQSVELPGVAEPLRRAALSAETAGRVERIAAQEGDFVAAGKPVCEMRRLPVELGLKQAQGLLDAALADLKKMEQGNRPEEIQQAEARMKAASATHQRWELEYERTKRLLAEGASTKAEFEATDAAHRQAEEALAEAEAGLRLAKIGFRVEDVDRARAQASAQQAAVDQLKDTLAKMTVTMPFDGFIVRKYTEVGEWLLPGQKVAEIVDLSVVRVLVDVPERYLGTLVKGAEAPVVFEGLGDREFKGVIAEIIPASAAGTHTIPVRIDIKNTIEGGKPTLAGGLFGRAWLPVGKEHPALLVPKSAVIRQQGQDLVYTVADTPPPEAVERLAKMAEMAKAMGGGNGNGTTSGKDPGPPQPPVKYAIAIPVRLVQGYGRLMEVESDRLKPGTPLITRGTYLMATGAPVQVQPKEGPPETPKDAGKAGAADPGAGSLKAPSADSPRRAKPAGAAE